MNINQYREELFLDALEQGFLDYDSTCDCNICRLVYKKIKLPIVYDYLENIARELKEKNGRR